jgi:hypothetical protein
VKDQKTFSQAASVSENCVPGVRIGTEEMAIKFKEIIKTSSASYSHSVLMLYDMIYIYI